MVFFLHHQLSLAISQKSRHIFRKEEKTTIINSNLLGCWYIFFVAFLCKTFSSSSSSRPPCDDKQDIYRGQKAAFAGQFVHNTSGVPCSTWLGNNEPVMRAITSPWRPRQQLPSRVSRTCRPRSGTTTTAIAKNFGDGDDFAGSAD